MKIYTKTPSRKKYEHRLNSTHMTTLDMCQIRPTQIIPVLGGDTIDLQYYQKTSISPLAVKSFASFDVRTMAFYVPMQSVWHYYNFYRTENLDSSVTSLYKPRQLRFIDILHLVVGHTPVLRTGPIGVVDWALSDELSVVDAVWSYPFAFSGDNWKKWNTQQEFSQELTMVPVNADFLLFSFDPSDGCMCKAVVLNSRGRQLVSLFEGLGYTIPRHICGHLGVPGNASSSLLVPSNFVSDFEVLDQIFDGAPILSFFRTIYDYIFPSRYLDYQGVGSYFQRDSENVTFDMLRDLAEMFLVPYDPDFWTSLFVSPSSSTSQSPFGADNNEGVSVSESSSSVRVSTGYLTNWLLSSLTHVSDFILRNNIAGSRFRDWCKAHGIPMTRQMEMDRSHLLRVFNNSVDINPVTNLADSTSAALGEQSGMMQSAGNGKLRFDVPEDGYVLFLSMLVPNIGYTHGLAPWTLLPTSPKDLYVPEFSSLGYEAIPNKCLFHRTGLRHFDGTLQMYHGMPSVDEPFGYAPRYTNRYRRSQDFLTGDFAFNSRNAAYGAFHSFRDIGKLVSEGRMLNNQDFLMTDTDFDRVFQQAPEGSQRGSLFDHFFCTFFFNVRKYSVVESMSDSLPFFDKAGDTTALEYTGTGGVNQ